MSIRTRFNERVSQMPPGEAISYGAGMFGGEVAGLVGGGIITRHSDTYNSLEDRITSLSHQNASISQLTEHHLLDGYRGKAAVNAFLQHRTEVNDQKIQTLRAEQPHELSNEAAIGLFIGMGLVGAVVGTALAYGGRKAAKTFRSRLKNAEA